MSFLRRYILIPIILWILLLGVACGAAGYYFDYWEIAFGVFALGTIAILIFKLHIPLQKILREMKALLTGKSYRRIMTSKRNEIGVLAHFFNEVTRSMESISGDVKSHERIKKELNTAQQIQRDLLPKNIPAIPGLQVTAKTRPASEIGGDTFDFIQKGDRNLMYIGDSTGHGIPAGIVMVMVDTLIETFMDLYDKPTDIMIQLNKYLKPHLQTTMFMTMILLEWEAQKKNMKWVGAGHEQIIHLKAADGTITDTKAGGIAVGMVPDNSKMVTEQNMPLQDGDFIVLFSDGITEVKNVAGQEYGLARLKETIKNHATAEASTDEVFKQIAIDVGRFMEGAAQLDDMTLIVIKATGQATQQTAQAEPKTTEWNAA